MGIMPQDDFDALWETIKEPLQKLDDRVTQVEKKSSRAEVAGAVENVAELPDPGQPGRMLYLTVGNIGLYVDQGDTWMGPVGGPVIARYHLASTQSIQDNTITIIDFDVKDYDTHDAVVTGAAWAFTAPIPGYYAVSVTAKINVSTYWTSGELARLHLYKNGALFSNLLHLDDLGNGTDSTGTGLSGSDIVYLDTGDTLDARIHLQSQGGAIGLSTSVAYNHIAIAKVG